MQLDIGAAYLNVSFEKQLYFTISSGDKILEKITGY
jgi:hypothetical protein